MNQNTYHSIQKDTIADTLNYIYLKALEYDDIDEFKERVLKPNIDQLNKGKIKKVEKLIVDHSSDP